MSTTSVPITEKGLALSASSIIAIVQGVVIFIGLVTAIAKCIGNKRRY